MAKTRKPMLTGEDHRLIGTKLKAIQREFVFLTVKIGNSHGSQYTTSALAKIGSSISQLRSKLEDQMFRDNAFPSGVARLDVYYGVPKEVNR